MKLSSSRLPLGKGKMRIPTITFQIGLIASFGCPGSSVRGTGEDLTSSSSSSSTNLPSNSNPTETPTNSGPDSNDLTSSSSSSTSTTSSSSSISTSSSSSTTGNENTEVGNGSAEPNICGNRVQENPEECDDGPLGSEFCTPECTIITCGDGIIQGLEECEDGNLEDIDLCNNFCKKSRFIFLGSDYMGGVGGFGGLVIADSFCQKDASKYGLIGSYKAWLNDSNDTLISRLNSEFFDGYYLLPKSKDSNFYISVANGWSSLVSGNLQHAIDTIANGSTPVETAMVWTNTNTDGHIHGSDTCCGNWTIKDQPTQGFVGISNAVDYKWTSLGPIGCDKGAKLYCIQVGD